MNHISGISECARSKNEMFASKVFSAHGSMWWGHRTNVSYVEMIWPWSDCPSSTLWPWYHMPMSSSPSDFPSSLWQMTNRCVKFPFTERANVYNNDHQHRDHHHHHQIVHHHHLDHNQQVCQASLPWKCECRRRAMHRWTRSTTMPKGNKWQSLNTNPVLITLG